MVTEIMAVIAVITANTSSGVGFMLVISFWGDYSIKKIAGVYPVGR